MFFFIAAGWIQKVGSEIYWQVMRVAPAMIISEQGWWDWNINGVAVLLASEVI